MKLFTLPWKNHRRTEWDHSHRQQKYLSAQPESPLKEKSSSPVKSLSQKDSFLFFSPPIASSISVARLLLTEKKNLFQTPPLPDVQQGFGADCCTSTHTKAAHPHPRCPPAAVQGGARHRLMISVWASKQLCWGKVWGSEKSGCSCHKHDNRQKLRWTAWPFKCA